MVDQTLTDFLAKLTEIPKTTVYRRLEELIALGLVEEQIDEYKKEYHAAPAETLALLVNKRDVETKDLVAQLPFISQLLTSTQTNQDPETKILFYRGKEGIQQMNWNALRAKKEIVGYSYRAWEEVVGVDFANKFLDEYNFLGLHGRDLISAEYIKSRKTFKDPAHSKWNNWFTRYLNPKVVDINHQMDIYNEVVAIYNWYEGEVFGVEIYNQKVANMQKQIFEVLWKLGKDNLKY